MIILGLDISTSNIGFCIIEKQKSAQDILLHASGMPLSKIKGMYAKAEAFKERLQEIEKIEFY